MISEKIDDIPVNTTENINNSETDNNAVANIISRNLVSLNRENEDTNNIHMVVRDIPIYLNNAGFFFPSVNIRSFNNFRRIRLRVRRQNEEPNIAYIQGFIIGFALNLFALFILIASRARPKFKTGMLLGMILGFCLFTAPFMEENPSKK